MSRKTKLIEQIAGIVLGRLSEDVYNPQGYEQTNKSRVTKGQQPYTEQEYDEKLYNMYVKGIEDAKADIKTYTQDLLDAKSKLREIEPTIEQYRSYIEMYKQHGDVDRIANTSRLIQQYEDSVDMYLDQINMWNGAIKDREEDIKEYSRILAEMDAYRNQK